MGDPYERICNMFLKNISTKKIYGSIAQKRHTLHSPYIVMEEMPYCEYEKCKPEKQERMVEENHAFMEAPSTSSGYVSGKPENIIQRE
jgi:hypothetical protein